MFIKNPCAFRAYVSFRNKYKKAVNHAKLLANQNFIEAATNNCRAAWKMIKSVTSTDGAIGVQ